MSILLPFSISSCLCLFLSPILPFFYSFFCFVCSFLFFLSFALHLSHCLYCLSSPKRNNNGLLTMRVQWLPHQAVMSAGSSISSCSSSESERQQVLHEPHYVLTYSDFPFFHTQHPVSFTAAEHLVSEKNVFFFCCFLLFVA